VVTARRTLERTCRARTPVRATALRTWLDEADQQTKASVSYGGPRRKGERTKVKSLPSGEVDESGLERRMGVEEGAIEP
jgi:hypothetical protein